ncbi:MAG: mycofactocin-associated electron transfer flavoprotein beta subunit [Acidimicrobiales bacterium]
MTTAVPPVAVPPVAVLLKWIDLRPVVDPLTGAVTHDPHGGLSASDQCALELALRVAAAEGRGVRAVSAGPTQSDAVLRLALECGAAEAVRVDLHPDAPSDDVAAALAAQVVAAPFVFCGDHSLDRGTGSVPAFVAGLLQVAQVLGAASVEARGGTLRIERRLDRGRREIVDVAAPAVVSVEGGLAPLRRPSLPQVLRWATAPIPTVTPGHRGEAEPGRTLPYRPRPRVLDGPDAHLPTRQRLLSISGALAVLDPPRLVVATPDEAADELLAFLSSRGYLAGSEAPASAPAPPASPASPAGS